MGGAKRNSEGWTVGRRLFLNGLGAAVGLQQVEGRDSRKAFVGIAETIGLRHRSEGAQKKKKPQAVLHSIRSFVQK